MRPNHAKTKLEIQIFFRLFFLIKKKKRKYPHAFPKILEKFEARGSRKRYFLIIINMNSKR